MCLSSSSFYLSTCLYLTSFLTISISLSAGRGRKDFSLLGAFSRTTISSCSRFYKTTNAYIRRNIYSPRTWKNHCRRPTRRPPFSDGFKRGFSAFTNDGSVCPGFLYCFRTFSIDSSSTRAELRPTEFTDSVADPPFFFVCYAGRACHGAPLLGRSSGYKRSSQMGRAVGGRTVASVSFFARYCTFLGRRGG